jgi:tRNA threonylcarbamoyladenosine biosynthesis protein TsaB
MKLLAWDTSSKAAAIAAFECSSCLSLVSEFSFSCDCSHSERLVWGIHQTLEAARWQLEEVDLFAVGVGPGSFTGLRIGVTTARSFAHLLKKPLVGVSSLAALARPVALSFSQSGCEWDPWVIATTDACKGELFALWGKAQELVQSGGVERVTSPEELIQILSQQIQAEGKKGRWVAVGEGRKRYSELWAQLPLSQELIPSLLGSDFVQGRMLGQLAWEAYQQGRAQDALGVFPSYLRASDAELKLKAGLLKPVGL